MSPHDYSAAQHLSHMAPAAHVGEITIEERLVLQPDLVLALAAERNCG
jgi:hypothetical protein